MFSSSTTQKSPVREKKRHCRRRDFDPVSAVQERRHAARLVDRSHRNRVVQIVQRQARRGRADRFTELVPNREHSQHVLALPYRVGLQYLQPRLVRAGRPTLVAVDELHAHVHDLGARLGRLDHLLLSPDRAGLVHFDCASIAFQNLGPNVVPTGALRPPHQSNVQLPDCICG